MLAMLDQQSARWLRCWHRAVKGTITDEAQPLRKDYRRTQPSWSFSYKQCCKNTTSSFLSSASAAITQWVLQHLLRPSRPTALCLPTP